MRRFALSIAAVSLMSSPAFAEVDSCRTDDAACQGFTDFGPAMVARCISIRGETRTDFCQAVGDTQRVEVHIGDQYCAVLGSEPVPEQCTLHWIIVAEPQ